MQIDKRTGLLGAVGSVVGIGVLLTVGCGGRRGTEADEIGVAAECESIDDCPLVVVDGEDVQLSCLTQFKGGYCAIEDCESRLDCPQGASCVAHSDGSNYCFRGCVNKAECNYNRGVDWEANCSANFEYASSSDNESGVKACIPPSG